MTTLFLATNALTVPGSAPMPADYEPTRLGLQRWEDDGGAVSPDASKTRRIKRSWASAAVGRAAA
jgi:hypothetical protein